MSSLTEQTEIRVAHEGQPTVRGQRSPERPLAGKTAWLITDGKMGMDVQARGVADALGLVSTMKHVAPSGAYKFFAPYAPVRPSEKGMFDPPWPDLAIATGRLAIPYLRALKKRAGLATYTVILQDPKTGVRSADLVWVPAHDRLRGHNVVTTVTAPHSFTHERFSALRAEMPAEIAALPGPRIGVILGGKNGVYKFTDACDDRLEASLLSLARLGVSFMITPSRRTHPRLLSKVDHATAAAPRLLWRGDGANPYPQFLAHADAFVVTADSVNMCGEAAATGKPVYIFMPSGGSPKFMRFHEALKAQGATRLLPASLEKLDNWSYTPLDAAEVIAAEVERRWSKRRVMLG
jgi:uncharacterized protein